jgi:hypothetical protein
MVYLALFFHRGDGKRYRADYLAMVTQVTRARPLQTPAEGV